MTVFDVLTVAFGVVIFLAVCAAIAVLVIVIARP